MLRRLGGPGMHGAGGMAFADLGGNLGQIAAMPYDAIPNLVHVYEPARRTLSAYTGNLVRLRRDSDDAESDFGYVAATGELNLAAIAAWLGAASGYVVSIYDQVTGDTITQAAKAAQPLFVAAAKNGHAACSGNGTGMFLAGAFTAGGALSQPHMAYTVCQLDASVVDDGVRRYIIDGDDVTGRIVIGTESASTPDSWRLFAGATISGGVADANWSVFAGLYNGASSQLWRNGASIAGPGDGGAANADGLTMLAPYTIGAVQPWKGYGASVVIADPSHTDLQRAAMQTAINAYWSVY